MRRTFGLALLLVACASAPRPGPAAGAAERLVAVVEAHFEASLELDPMRATLFGDHRFDDRLGDPAAPATFAAKERLGREALADAEAIDPAELSPRDQLVREVFLAERRTELESFGFPGRLLPIDQLDGFHAFVAIYGAGDNAQPFETVADHERWLRRAAELPTWVDSAIAAMREGIAAGITHPKVAMAELVPQLSELAVADPAASIFFGPVRKLDRPEISAADRARLTAAYDQLIREVLAPSYGRLHAFVRDEYVPACRDTLGLSALPNGAAWYRFKIREMTTTALDPDTIHAMGLAEVARIRREMEAVRDRVGFTGDLAAFFAHVQRREDQYFARGEELVAAYSELKRTIDAALPRLFGRFPKADYLVKEVEPFRAKSASGAEYYAAAPDGSRPGIFYVNTFNLKAQPRFGMETLSLHEASPGHHFQTSIQQEQEDLPRFRRFAEIAAYDEGWALYAESLGPELGLFRDPLSLFGRLNDEQLRAMRLVVDTGLHAKGWTREQAIAFMIENSSLARSDVEAEVDRYLVWPGQALAYKVGERTIRGLRTRAEATLGARFDVRAFHDVILGDGAVPLDVLTRKVERWLATF